MRRSVLPGLLMDNVDAQLRGRGAYHGCMSRIFCRALASLMRERSSMACSCARMPSAFGRTAWKAWRACRPAGTTWMQEALLLTLTEGWPHRRKS